jgi:O-antigen ligase
VIVQAGSPGQLSTRDASPEDSTSPREHAGAFLLAALVASLPFWPIRVTAGLGTTHLILLAAIPLAVGTTMVRGRLRYRPGPVDLFLIAYLGMALASTIVSPQQQGLQAITKSVAYWGSFVCLAIVLRDVPRALLARACVSGVVAGTVLFGAAAAWVIGSGQVSIRALSPSSIYWDLTFPIYRGLLTSAGGLDDVSSADVMRSAIGEVFALYGLVLLLFTKRTTRWTILLLIVVGAIAWAVASRRAGLALVVGFVLLAVRWRRKRVGLQLVALLAALTIGLTVLPAYLGRFAQLGSSQRLEQFGRTVALIAERPLFGYGFASQVDDRYVHNILLGSWYMLGLLGLALAIWLVGYFAIHTLRAADRSAPAVGVLLLIPLIGVSVGSTTEGTFTIVGWVSILTWSLMVKSDPEGASDGVPLGRG